MKIGEKQILKKLAKDKKIPYEKMVKLYNKVNDIVICNVLNKEDFEWFCQLLDQLLTLKK